MEIASEQSLTGRFDWLVDWLYPPRCRACGARIHGRDAEYRRGAEGARHGDADQYGHGAPSPGRRARESPLRRTLVSSGRKTIATSIAMHIKVWTPADTPR